MVCRNPQVRQNEIAAAVKLSHAFAAVSAALDRRQGRGTMQKVVVERVVVQDGGRAVVGAVTGGRGPPIGEGGTDGN